MGPEKKRGSDVNLFIFSATTKSRIEVMPCLYLIQTFWGEKKKSLPMHVLHPVWPASFCPPPNPTFPGSSASKESTCDGGDLGSVPWSERSPGEGMATPSSILAWRISWTRGAWQATVHGIAKSPTWLRDEHRHVTVSLSLIGVCE